MDIYEIYYKKNLVKGGIDVNPSQEKIDQAIENKINLDVQSLLKEEF